MRGFIKRIVIFTFFLLSIMNFSSISYSQDYQDLVRMDDKAKKLRELGRYDEAEKIAKQVLILTEQMFPTNHPNIASALNNLANTYQLQERYKETEQLRKRALKILIANFGTENPSVTLVQKNLGATYLQLGAYKEAEKIFNQVLLARQKSLPPSDPKIADALNALGSAYKHQGRLSEAETLYSQAIAISTNASNSESGDLALYYENIAEIYLSLGRYLESEKNFNQALILKEKILGADNPRVASNVASLASSLLKQERYDEAAKLYQRAINIFLNTIGENSNETLRCFHNIALLYHETGQYAEAEKILEKYLPITEKNLGSESHEVANGTALLAGVKQGLNKVDEAERLFKKSIEIYEKQSEMSALDMAKMLNNLGTLYNEHERYVEAEPLFKKALFIYQKEIPNHPSIASFQNNLALMYYNKKRYSDALSIIKPLINTENSPPILGLEILQASEQNNILNKNESLFYSYCVIQSSFISSTASAVVKLSQRFSARDKQLGLLIRNEQDLESEKAKLDKLLINEASKNYKERNLSHEEQARLRILKITKEHEQLRSTLNEKFPEYVALSNPRPLSISETQSLLNSDEAVAILRVARDNLYSWVVTKTDASWIQTPVKSADLNAEVSELRQSLTFSENGKAIDRPFNSALAFKIYQQTLGPIADKIAGKKRLSIIANGALTSIPLGLLVSKDPAGKSLKDTDWLIKSYAITVLPSIYSLKTMRAQAGVSSAAKPMIAFADPVFSKAAQAQANQQVAMRSMTSFYNGTQIDIRGLGEHLPQLPNTRDEVQTISRELGAGSDDIKLGLQATETAVKQAKLDQYRIVYFATHGLVAGDLEKFSKAKAEPALALTIPSHPTDQDDGLLQASEIAQLKLNADWAVLSACNTASSDGVGAEALTGLARAFIYAGARSLLVSNWDVSDDATKSLMTSLFEISSKNKSLSHGEALQQATLQLLNNAKTEEEAHPRYWAPFIVVGEPDNKMLSQ